eukprot:scaffold4420_cov187-Amphora_coffeaeformis.AAC.31
MASKSWIISATLLVGCNGMNVADAFLPISGIAGIGFFHQAKRMGGIREFIPRKDAKQVDRFNNIFEIMAEEAALMTEPITSATTRFLMDRVGDAHHQLLDKTIGEMKEVKPMKGTLTIDDVDGAMTSLSAPKTIGEMKEETHLLDKTVGELKAERSIKVTLIDDENDNGTSLPASASTTESLTSATGRFLLDRLEDNHTPHSKEKTIGELKAETSANQNSNDNRAVSEDMWGDNGSTIQAASERFQKDLQKAKMGSRKESEKQDPLSVLANASLGLTAPIDLLKDDTELKHREEEVAMADEKAQKRARIVREQTELRELMKYIQHASMEKKQRAKDAREKGSFPVILAALAESDSDALKKSEPEMFERGFHKKPSGPAIGQPDELTFEQLNKQIRMKWEQEKMKQTNKRETIVVVKKLERDGSNRGGVARAALRLIKRSLNPLRAAVSK